MYSSLLRFRVQDGGDSCLSVLLLMTALTRHFEEIGP